MKHREMAITFKQTNILRAFGHTTKKKLATHYLQSSLCLLIDTKTKLRNPTDKDHTD
jgi:hypothetical protein